MKWFANSQANVQTLLSNLIAPSRRSKPCPTQRSVLDGSRCESYVKHQCQGEKDLVLDLGSVCGFKSVRMNESQTFGEIVYQDGSKYFGQILVVEEKEVEKKGLFHSIPDANPSDLLMGFNQQPSVRPPARPVTVNNFSKCKIKREGLGELRLANGNRYSGNFKDDEQSGFGVMLFNSKFSSQYYGLWKHNQQSGHGVCLYEDGSIYEGDWENGKRHGVGNFRLSNGFEIRGKWINNDIGQAKFLQNSISDAPTCSNLLLKEVTSKVRDLHFSSSSPYQSDVRYPENRLSGKKWEHFCSYDMITHEHEKFSKKFEEKKNSLGIRQNEEFVAIKQLLENQESILRQCLDRFRTVFAFRYNVTTERTAAFQKPHALDDILSFINYLHSLIAFEIVKVDNTSQISKDIFYWIHDMVIHECYPMLISIYRLVYCHEDDEMTLKLETLQNVKLEDLGVNKALCELSSLFESMIVYLQDISTKDTPTEQLKVLTNVRTSILMGISNLKQGKKSVLAGADDLTPIFMYLFIKANLPYPHSTCKFLLDFQDKRTSETGADHSFTFLLELPCDFVRKTDWNVRDENGYLAQSSIVEANFERKLEKILRESKLDKEEFLKFIRNVYVKVSLNLNISAKATTVFDSDLAQFAKFGKQLKELLRSTGLSFRKEKNQYVVVFETCYPQYTYYELAKKCKR